MATLPIELLETKLLSPARSRALIPRTDLVERLRAANGASVITILAAPGFGKTTLLTEWLASDDRPFAWISLDDRDNDPVVFLTYIAVALNKISPIDVSVFEALAAAIPSIEGRVIPRLSAAAAAMDFADRSGSRRSAHVDGTQMPGRTCHTCSFVCRIPCRLRSRAAVNLRFPYLACEPKEPFLTSARRISPSTLPRRDVNCTKREPIFQMERSATSWTLRRDGRLDSISPRDR